MSAVTSRAPSDPLESCDNTALDGNEVIGARGDLAGSAARIRRSDADEDVSPSRAVEDLGHLKPPLQGEMAEAFDAWRKGRDNFGEELADVAIYLLRLAEMTGVDLQDEIETKMAKNAARVYQRLPNGVLAKSSDDAG